MNPIGSNIAAWQPKEEFASGSKSEVEAAKPRLPSNDINRLYNYLQCRTKTRVSAQSADTLVSLLHLCTVAGKNGNVRPGSNFNQQDGSEFTQRQRPVPATDERCMLPLLDHRTDRLEERGTSWSGVKSENRSSVHALTAHESRQVLWLLNAFIIHEVQIPIRTPALRMSRNGSLVLLEPVMGQAYALFVWNSMKVRMEVPPPVRSYHSLVDAI